MHVLSPTTQFTLTSTALQPNLVAESQDSPLCVICKVWEICDQVKESALSALRTSAQLAGQP
jgi:hypothetical protein